MDLFEREDLQRLIRLLAVQLDSRGVTGTVSIVGGAALSIQYLVDRDSTTDIDALLPQNPQVTEVINEIALQENLPSNWINDAVKAYVPFETQSMWVELFTVGGITIRVATADLLLAMKLKADRGMRDRPDIEGLIRLSGHKEFSQIRDVYEKFHHQEVMAERTSRLVQGILASF